jgi:hypothetical protein
MPTFPEQLPRSSKASRGRPGVASTPLAIRSRIPLDDATREMVRVRLGRRLGSYALHVQRATVRFEDVNGPRGGIDVACRVKIVLDGLPSIVVEKRAPQAIDAVVPAAEAVRRALRRTLQRAGHTSSRNRKPKEQRERTGGSPPNPPQRDDEGSLICRRVGRSKANLERALARPEKVRRDAYVDTAAPGTSASERRAGYGATAARNTRRRTSGMASALEDSRTRPSRKSTRKSANRTRAATALELRATLRTRSPKSRAERARARRPR